MRGALTEFNRISNTITIFRDSVNHSLRRYGEKVKAIKRQAEDYKDETAYIEKNIAPLKEEARKEISAARRDLNKGLETEREALEKLLYEKVSAVPPVAFSSLLRFFHDFDLTPNRMEISALLAASNGNALAIRALNGLLEKTGAGYRVAATPYDAFAADLDRITRLQQTFWTGTEYPAEAGEVFNGTPRATYNKDGKEVNVGYRWDSTSRAMENAAFIENMKKLEEAAEAWSAEVLPKIVEDERGKLVQVPHDLPPVEEAQDSAEAFAKRTGAEMAAEEAKAKSVLEFYSRH